MSDDDSVRRTLDYLERLLQEQGRRYDEPSGRREHSGDSSVSDRRDDWAGGTEAEDAGPAEAEDAHPAGAEDTGPAGAEDTGPAEADVARPGGADSRQGGADSDSRASGPHPGIEDRATRPEGEEARAGNGVRPYRRLTTRLGTLLLDEGLISSDDLDRALQEHRSHGERLGHYLVEQGLVREADLIRVLAQQYGVPAADLDGVEVEEQVLDLIPVEMARRYLVVPLAVTGGALDVAMVDPTDVVAVANLKFATGLRPQPLIATERMVLDAIGRLYETRRGDETESAEQELASRDLRRELRQVIQERDQAVMDVGSDPRAAYRLAVHIDDLVEEIIDLVVERISDRRS